MEIVNLYWLSDWQMLKLYFFQYLLKYLEFFSEKTANLIFLKEILLPIFYHQPILISIKFQD